MDGLLPSSTSNGNTKILNSSFPNCLPASSSHPRPYDPSSLVDNYINSGPLEPHQANFSPSESLYQPYLHANANNNPYYDQTHGLSSQMSQMSLDSANNINQRKSFNENNLLNASNKMVLTQRAEMSAINAQNDNLNSSFFVSDFIKEEILKKLVKSQEIPTESMHLELPARVDVYIELLPIESLPGTNSYTFNGMVSSVYRAMNSETGQLFCLKRFHGFQPSTANTKLLMGAIDTWKKVQHASIVPLRQVFTTKAFGDNSVIFVYDYYPASETLMACYFSSQLNSLNAHSSTIINGYSTSSRPYSQQQNTRKFLPEQTIWNYIIQISSALRAIHQANLAFRSLDPTKVIITSGWSNNTNNSFSNRGRNARIRLAFCGVSDILTLDAFLHSNPRVIIQHFQQEELVLFGRLCLALATNSLSAYSQQDNLQEYLDMIPRAYSNDLKNLITYLISFKTSNPNKPRSIDDIMPMIGARFYMQLDHLYYRYDNLYEELFKEMDNGRLLRLLTKLGTINERPEHQLDPNWSETGDRYMLKLFRDYLFHQFDEEGRPWLDLGHIISNLNKFDVGSPEKVCLVSRDAQNVIIASFEELKRCFETAINDLMQ